MVKRIFYIKENKIRRKFITSIVEPLNIKEFPYNFFKKSITKKEVYLICLNIIFIF